MSVLIEMKMDIEDKDVNYSRVLKALDSKASHVDVGIHAFTGAELVTIASANEFGAMAGRNRKVRIPERSFIRSTVDSNRTLYRQEGETLINRIVDGKITQAQGLGLLGRRVQRDIQRTIRSNVPPPNAPSTIAAKGSDHTLIDTAAMLQAVTYAVKTAQEQVVEVGEFQTGTGKAKQKRK